MAVNVRALVEATALDAAALTLYTAAERTRVIIDKVTLTNVDADAQAVSLYIVAAGETIDNYNRILATKNIAAGATYLCPEIVGHTLNPGDFIVSECSEGATVNIRISGREVVS